jgi:hypothetical protein
VKLEPRGAVLLLPLRSWRADVPIGVPMKRPCELDQVLMAINGLLKIWPVVRRDMIWWS